MKISFSMPTSDLKDRNNGFSTAGYGIVTSLQQLGHDVPYRDVTAPVTFNFCHPPYAEWGNHYNIIMPAWESTQLPDDWVEYLHEADEVWAPSGFVKGVLEDHGVKVEKIYPHGIDPQWIPTKRVSGKPLKFLHCGEPAPRKGGQMAFDAFREAFGDRDDVHLTIKAMGRSMVWAGEGYGNGRMPPDRVFDNVSIVRSSITVEEMVKLHHDHDVFVYPSWGEGFGLFPLQAMATGMPIIAPWIWAEYWTLLHPDLTLESNSCESPWPKVHPGKMFKPDFDDLVKAYLRVENDYSHYAALAEFDAARVHYWYDWTNLTREAFKDVVDNFG